MGDKSLSYVPGEYDAEVDPVHKKRQASGTYTDRYGYTEIIHSYDPDDVFPSTSVFHKSGSSLYYRYPGKAAVMIDGDETRVHRNFSERQGQQQTYFVLSMLEAEGYVTGWTKVNP